MVAVTAIFVLNHNWICRELIKVYPNLGDEKLFQECRRRNIAHYQNIVYNEFLTQELALDLGVYTGYDPKVNFTKYAIIHNNS